MNSVLEAHYSVTSRWELPFDLNYVAEWHVKHDTLYVKFNTSDREFAAFEPDVRRVSSMNATFTPWLLSTGWNSGLGGSDPA
jgi:hypothetical protein